MLSKGNTVVFLCQQTLQALQLDINLQHTCCVGKLLHSSPIENSNLVMGLLAPLQMNLQHQSQDHRLPLVLACLPAVHSWQMLLYTLASIVKLRMIAWSLTCAS